MSALTGTSLAIVGLSLLWLVLGIAIAVIAARRYRLAQSVLDTARAHSQLLELMPSRPLVVRPDGRIEADERLVRELGLESVPAVLSDLATDGSGIVAEDFDVLGAMVEGARLSAGRVSCHVRTQGPGRTFDVRGGPAPPGEPAGTLLL